MTAIEYGKVISRNLRRIAYENQKTQADIARDLNLKQATVSSWMNGTRIPRMKKIDLLCHYFNCTRIDIMEEHDHSQEPIITAEEKMIISAYRSSDTLTQQMILRLLNIETSKEGASIA